MIGMAAVLIAAYLKRVQRRVHLVTISAKRGLVLAKHWSSPAYNLYTWLYYIFFLFLLLVYFFFKEGISRNYYFYCVWSV